MEVILANPRGFCAGVDRAIAIVNRALEVFKPPIYVRHEVVHNKFVVDDLRDRGAIFVDELDEVPADAIVIFSAHGVSKSVQQEANARGLKVFDATCPLVTKVHMEVVKFSELGYECILIGHQGHPEVEGTMGRFEKQFGGDIYLVESVDQIHGLAVKNPSRLAYVTQTTLSVDDTAAVIDALREKYPAIQGPKKDDICYATQNRQDAVKALSRKAEVVFVVGSPNSSNSNRLRELAERSGARSYLIDRADEIQPHWLEGVNCVGITAGASAPEQLVQAVSDRLVALGGTAPIELEGRQENIVFSMPKALKIEVREPEKKPSN